MILADTIVLIDHGKIEQAGTYEELYNFPKNIFIADFVSLDVDTPAINLLDGAFIHSTLSNMIVGVRPPDIEIVTKNTRGSITGFIFGILHVGLKDTTILYIKIGRGEIVAEINLNKNLSVQSNILLRFRRYHTFEKHSGLRIKTI